MDSNDVVREEIKRKHKAFDKSLGQGNREYSVDEAKVILLETMIAIFITDYKVENEMPTITMHIAKFKDEDHIDIVLQDHYAFQPITRHSELRIVVVPKKLSDDNKK